MTFISEPDLARLRDSFVSSLKTEVEVRLTMHEGECEVCDRTEALLGEVVSASPKLSMTVRAEAPQDDGVVLPRTSLEGIAAGAVRFIGTPAGYELPAFIDSLVEVSTGESALSSEGRDRLRALDEQVHIQVFTTPT